VQELNKDDIVKAEILKAAASVFQKWGYDKATMEDIAREAGKGKSTLYYYYKSKEEIFVDVIMDEIAEINKIAKNEIAKVDSSIKKLKVYVHTIFVELRKRANLHSIIRGEIRGNQEIIRLIRFAYDSNEEKLIQEILKEGINKKEFTNIGEKNVALVSHAIMSLIRGVAIELFVEHDTNDDYIDTFIGLLSTGL
jgi:AcrR family transcriptional regulator